MSAGTRALAAAERIDWLRLARAENVGPITFFRLLERFGRAGAALEALPDLAARGGRRKGLKIPGKAEVQRELAALDKRGARLIAAIEPAYPPLLRTIEDPPPLIAVDGHAHLLARPAVAMVGARNASLNGQRLAERMAADLAGAGWVVVSGLARGIDGAAHTGALGAAAGEGGTVAVVAGGLDHIFPPEHTALQGRIASEGAVVAESPLGQAPTARHFPRRNRIIAALARAVVVVEGAAKSGSLITARLAGEQGREVCAVPGSPLDPRAKGTNNLIRYGAHLVETAEDVIQILTLTASGAVAQPSPALQGVFDFDGLRSARPSGAQGHDEADKSALESAREALARALGPAPTPIDELIRRCQLTPAAVATVLLEMELAGAVQRLPGGQVARLVGEADELVEPD